MSIKNPSKSEIVEKSKFFNKIIKKTGDEKTFPIVGNTVDVNYIGTFPDSGKKFEEIKNKIFILGKAEVIKGLEEAVTTMSMGEISIFTVPSNLAYGVHGAGNDIPPNTTINLEIELISIK